MKLYQLPCLFSVLRLLRLLPLNFCGTALLTAAPAPAQTFYRPLRFEQNRGHASKEVKRFRQSYPCVTKESLAPVPAPG
jgi:hypothetical protein